MPSEFRPSTPSDGPALLRMARRLLDVAADDPMFGEAQLHWKYWAPWRGAASPRSYVLVRDGGIVAHAGALPLACRTGGRTLALLHPFDWMSEPNAIGGGAALLQRLGKLADGVLVVGGSEMTRRMVRPLGFRALGDVTLYAAPAQLPRDGAAEDSSLSVARVAEPTAEHCAGIEPPPPWVAALRAPERLSDALGCPVAATTVHVVRREDTPLGGFALALAPGQARIVALWPARDARDLPALVGAARRQAASQHAVSEVVCMASEPLERAALSAAGFRETGAVPMFLRSTARELGPDVQFAFQMLDGDIAFLHHGAPQPWL